MADQLYQNAQASKTRKSNRLSQAEEEEKGLQSTVKKNLIGALTDAANADDGHHGDADAQMHDDDHQK